MHTPLDQDHSPHAISARLQQVTQHGALGDFVLGAVDGAVTTFAIVAGVAGAGLSISAALVLGLANVLADGFSMAVGQYLKTRSDHEVVERYRRMEEHHIEHIPLGEQEEIRQIFAAKGFSGETLEEIVTTITSDRERWINTMLTEEWGLQLQLAAPLKAAWVTFSAFVLAGAVPLLPLFLETWLGADKTFIASSVCTAITFAVIGVIRGKLSHQPVVRALLETLFVGGSAALLAFAVGALLRRYIAVD